MPGPVSAIENRTRLFVPLRIAPTSTRTAPESVNLTALPIKFSNTCRTLPGSPSIHCGADSAICSDSATPFWDAGSAKSASIELRLSSRSNRVRISLSRPASIFVKSRMSSMISNNASAERSMVSKYARCFSVSGLCFSNVIMPITPFIGVRIS